MGRKKVNYKYSLLIEEYQEFAGLGITWVDSGRSYFEPAQKQWPDQYQSVSVFKGFDGYRCNADWNASQNIGQWEGFSCPLSLQDAVSAMGTDDSRGGVNDSPLTKKASKRMSSLSA